MDFIFATLFHLLLSLGLVTSDDKENLYQTLRNMENIRYEKTEDGRVAIYAGGEGAVIIVFG
ncbi:MAG: hypothetical protein NZM15_03275 [Flavobacteriales bacterium]|nr:hypothetical protein [Flavobacteriales bacterium]MDW8431706.1 hypothetical protein [Flavobacteriales bacterium]